MLPLMASLRSCEEPLFESWKALERPFFGILSSLLILAARTTTELTTKFAQGIASFLNLSSIEGGIEVIVRGVSGPFFTQ